jgi:hypothetical protein
MIHTIWHTMKQWTTCSHSRFFCCCCVHLSPMVGLRYDTWSTRAINLLYCKCKTRSRSLGLTARILVLVNDKDRPETTPFGWRVLLWSLPLASHAHGGHGLPSHRHSSPFWFWSDIQKRYSFIKALIAIWFYSNEYSVSSVLNNLFMWCVDYYYTSLKNASIVIMPVLPVRLPLPV